MEGFFLVKNSKKLSTDPTKKELLQKVLQDKTRLQIIIYLLTYNKLTLKELSERFNKGKTTIHHHLHKLEDESLVSFEEDEQDKRKIKTRYYSVSKEQFSFLIPNSKRDSDTFPTNEAILTECVLNQMLIELLSGYLEEKLESKELEKDKISSVYQTFILNKRTQPIYEEFLHKMQLALQEENKSNPDSEATHIVIQANLPIVPILKWKQNRS